MRNPRLLSLLFLLAFILSATSFASRVYHTPFKGRLTVSRLPRLSGDGTLSLELRSNLDEPVFAEVILVAPDGVEFLSQSRFERVYLPPNGEISLNAVISVSRPGEYPIQAIVYPFGQHFSISLHVDDSGSSVSRVVHLPERALVRSELASVNPQQPDTLKVFGRVTYYDDNERKFMPIKNLPLELFDSNMLFDAKLSETVTDEEGRFEFPPVSNREADGTRLDVYILAAFNNSVLSIEDGLGKIYQIISEVVRNAPDGEVEINLFLDENHPNRGLGAIFNEVQKVHDFFLKRVSWSRRKLPVLYPSEGDTLFYSYSYNQLSGQIVSERMNIPYGEEWHKVGLFHEYGHSVMSAAYGFNFYELPISERFADRPHWVYTVSDERFAMNEGWAEFVESAVEDNAFNLRGYVNADLPNIETNRWWTGAVDGKGTNDNGAIVEGSVASILWDIFDTPQSTDTTPGVDDDRINDMFGQLWLIFTTDHPKSILDIAEGWRKYGFENYDALVEIFTSNGVQLDLNQPPSIRIISPSQLIVTSSEVHISWEASDPDGDPVTVDLYYDTDQTPPGTLIASGLNGKSYDWNPVDLGLPDGRYYIYAVACDPKGAKAQSYGPTPIIVDRSPLPPPLITSPTHPDQSRWYPTGNVTLKLESRSQTFSIVLDRSPDTTPDEKADLFKGMIGYSNLSDGIWWFHARAYSTLGYWSGASHFSFRIDSSPPPPPGELDIELVKGEMKGMITWKPVEDLSGISGYEVQVDVDSTDFSQGLVVDRSVTEDKVKFDLIPDRTYHARVRAVNGAGLSSRWSYSPDFESPKIVPWDINGDGTVDIFDLVLVAKNFGKVSVQVDLNGDGKVDVLDLVLVGKHFGEQTGQAAPMEKVVGSTKLLQCYPNPFNPETWLPFTLGEFGRVKIIIYDLNGRTVRHIDMGVLEPGNYIERSRAPMWDGRDDRGERLPCGIYFYSLQVDGKLMGLKKAALER